jgi:tetratricopeptide (TPR) repeat protein
MLPGAVMEMAAGEFKGVVADFLVMEIGAFIDSGRNKSDADWDRAAFHFSQVMALDPYFAQTYRLIQAYLPSSGHVQTANELLEIARQHLPWDWYPAFFLGFNYFNDLKDYAKASKYLIMASKIKGAPPILATLGSRLAQKSGQTLTAIGFLKTMHGNPDYDEEAKKLIAARIQTLEGVLILERAAEIYHQRFGHSITTLEDLIRSGILKQLPKHGEMGSYGYADGKITY